jgi:PAS domain S-box-containing protein
VSEASRPKKTQIAIAVGDSAVLTDIRLRLERLGHVVCGAVGSVEDVLRLVEQDRPELIILGVDLVNSETATEIRKVLHSDTSIPVVIAANHVGAEQWERAELPFTYGFMRLPANDAELQISVETALISAEMKEARDTAEAALRETDARIRGILEVSPDSVMIVNLDGVILDCNNSAVTMRGFADKNELIDLNLIDLVAPEDRYKAVEFMAEIQQGNASMNTECRFLKKTGQVFWAEIRAGGIEDSSGNISSFACVAKDISDRKIAEEVLRSSSDIVEAIPSGLFIYRYKPPDQLILMSGNPEAERLTGVKIAQWCGKEFNEIWPQARGIGFTDALLEVMETGEIYETEDLHYRDDKLDGGFRIRAFRMPNQLLGVAFENITERKRAEEERRALISIVEKSRDFIGLATMDGEVTYLNEAGCRMVGLDSLEQAQSTVIFDYVSDDVIRLINEEAIPSVMAQGFWQAESTIRHFKTGRDIDIEVMLFTLETRAGQGPKGLAVIIRDITDRKLHEARLRHETEKFKVLVENSPMGVSLITTVGEYEYVNPKFVEIFGYGLEDIPTGRDWFEKAYPNAEYRAEVMAAWKGDLEKYPLGESRPRTYQVTCKDGKEKTIRFAPVGLPDGKQLVLCEDITEQRRQEEDLRFLSSIVRQVSDSVIVTDPDFNIVYVNRAAETLYGYEWDDFIGRTPGFLSGEASSDDIFRDIFETVTVNKKWFGTFLNRKKSGELFVCEMSFSSLVNAEGRIAGYISLIRDITGRQHIEMALRESETTLRSIFKAAPIGIGLVSDRVFKQVNDEFCHMVGYSREELIDQSARMVYPSQAEYDRVGRVKYAQIGRRGTGTVETRWVRKDGEEIDVLLSSTSLDPADLKKGVTFTALEITERKRAEAALREQRDRAQKYLDVAGVMFVAIRPDQTVGLINEKGCQILGYDENAIVGMNWFDHFLPERMREDVKTVFDKLMKREIEGAEFYENPVLTKNGEERLIAWHNVLMSDEDGNVVASLSSGEDITDRKRAEEELDRLFSMSVDMLCVAGFDGYFKQVNPAWTRVLGWSPEELMGRPWLEFVHPDDREETLAAGQRFFDGVAAYAFENRYLCKDGSYRWLSWNSTPVLREELAYAVARDITDQKNMDEERERIDTQLRQSQKMEAIGTLAGGIAHDFNNILGALIGYVDLTMLDLPEHSTAYENLTQALTAASRAKDLVRQILTFSRQSQQVLQPIRVHPIIKEAVKFLRSSLPATIEIHHRITESDLAVLADPTQIHQIVMNLVTNAAHAIGRKPGIIEVVLSEVAIKEEAALHQIQPGQYLRLVISDTGSGMSPEVLDRIFEPYYTTKGPGEGTGMGLSVVHGIVQNYGGMIKAYSESGQGSAFHVYLPVAVAETESTVDSVEPAPRGDECILYVDDEEALVDIGRQMLERLGYTVKTFTDPEAALDAIISGETDYDLVITDLTMPRLTGNKLAEIVQDLRPDIPLVICTGFSESLDSERMKGKGVKAILNKPLLFRELATTIRSILDERPQPNAFDE